MSDPVSTVCFEFQRLGLDPATHEAQVRQLALVARAVLVNYPVFVTTALRRRELPLAVDLLHRMARVTSAGAQMLHDAYPGLTFPLAEVADGLVHEFTPETETGALRKVLRLCLKAPSSQEFNFLLWNFGLVARTSPGALDEVLALDRDRMQRQSASVREQWLTRGVDLITSGRSEEGIAFLRIQSAESRRLLGLTHGVLGDLRSVIAYYCSSLCGRTLGVLPLEVSSFKLDRPFTNGKAVFLPPTLALASDLETNHQLYTALAAQVAGALALGTFGFDPEKAGLDTELQDRYGLQLPQIGDVVNQEYRGRVSEIRASRTGDLEAVFPNQRKLLLLETSLETFFLRFPVPVLVRRLFGLLETHRIDARLTEKYPGLGVDLAQLGACQRTLRKAPARTSPEGTRDAQFEALLEAVILLALGRPSGPGDPALLTRVVPFFDRVAVPGATVEDTARAVSGLFQLLFERTNVVAWCALHDVRSFFDGLLQPAYHPEILLEDSPEFLCAADRRPRDQAPLADRGLDLTRTGIRDRKSLDFVKALQEGRTKVYRYPEFHQATGALEPAFCTLFEQAGPSESDGFYERTLKKHAFTWKKLRKKFLQLKPEELELQRKWLSGDEVHLDDALDYSTSLLRGSTPDEKIYSKKVVNVRDVALAVLVDSSSSTDLEVEGRKIIDIEKESLALLAGALDALGDDFAVYSFYSMGKDKTVFSVIKDFVDPWGAEARGRVGAFTAFAANRDGCAIRHTTAKLLDTPNKTKVLLMLSDGIPADLGYGDSAAETNRHAIEDTRRAVIEAKVLGIVPFCLTIDKGAKDYIAHLYGEFHYSILDDPSKLPERLSKLYLRITK